MYNARRHAVDKVAGCEDGIVPKTKRNMGLGEKSKSCFNKMTMLSFNRTVLLVSVWAGQTMDNASIMKIAM